MAPARPPRPSLVARLSFWQKFAYACNRQSLTQSQRPRDRSMAGFCCGRAGLGSASNRSDGSSGATAWLTPAKGRTPEVRPPGRPVTEVGGVSPAKDRQRRHQGRNTLSNFNLHCPRSRGARVLTRPAVNLRHRRIAEDHCRFVACQCQASLR